jgi:hypothetical protein
VCGNKLDDGVGCAIIRDVVFDGETGKMVVGGVATLCGSDDARREATLILGLDEWAEIDLDLVGFSLVFPVDHVARVDAQMREEVNHIH